MESQPPQPQPQPEPCLATAVPEHPVQAAPRRRGRPILMLFLLFVLFCLGGSLLLNLVLFSSGLASLGTKKVQEEYVSHEKTSSNKVAIITLKGTILSGEGFIKKQIDQVKKDENVKAVVLRINSPGGTITGSDYIYHQLKEMREERDIPIVVSMGAIAASGGYYAAMACGTKNENVIFAERSTWTGSIGVKIPHYDFSGLLKKYDIKDDTIASEELKTMGSFAKEMSPEEKAIWRALVDDAFGQFKDVIKEGRAKFAKDPEALDELATGQVYNANQAKENGLIDQIGFIEKAIARAVELTNLPENDVKVVRYKREPTLADVLMGTQAKKPSIDLGTLLEISTPRAYYILSWSPVVMERP